MSEPTREQVEGLINIATNGALDRIDQRAKRGAELRQWGLNTQLPEPGSPLAADDVAFEQAYPEALSGGQGVTEEALYPMLSAAECLGAVETVVQQRQDGSVYAVPVMQLWR